MKKLLTLLLTLATLSTVSAADFTSFQVASTTLTNGYILQTNGSRNRWVATSSLGFPNLLTSNNLWTGTNNYNATSTLFSLVTSLIRASSSAGIIFQSSNGTQVADFGAGGGSNASFYGGVNVTGNLAVDTDTLYVDTTNNRVGIGTTTPGYNAVISGSDAALSIDNNSGSASFIRMNNYGTLRFVLDARSAATSFNSLTAPLTFITSSLERVRIDNSGNVGIGTTTPTSQLSIVGSAGTGAPLQGGVNGATLSLLSTTNGVGDGGAVVFGTATGPNGFAGIKGFLQTGTANTAGDLAFYTRRFTSDANLTESMRILYNGNIGIGTTSPVALLNVSGPSLSGTSQVFTVSTTSSIVVAQANGRVGIGSNVGTPTAPLHIFTPVANSTTVTGQYIVNAGSGAGAGAELLLGYAATAAGSGGIASFYDTSHFNGTVGVKTRLSAGGTTFLTGSVTGDVGIGTTTPSARLAIQGQSGSTTPLFSIASSSGAVIPFVTVTPTGRFGISTTSPTSVFSVASTLSDTTQLFNILSSTVSAIIRVLANGSVLIGTPTQANCGVIECGLTVGTTTQFTAGIVARVVGYSSAASTTINLNTTDIATTTIDRATTFVNPTGTAYDGSMFEIRARATTTQTVYWDTAFASSTDLTNVSSVASGTTRFLFEYRQDVGKWELVGKLAGYIN